MAINYTPPTFQSSDSSPWKNLGFAGLAGLLTGSGGVAGTVLAGLGASDQMGNISNTQQNFSNYINSMMQQLPSQAQFKPYTVSTGLGSYSTDASGGVTGNLSAQQQALSNQAFGAAGNFMNLAQQQNPMLQGQANMFNNMAQGYQPSGFNQYNLQGQYNTGYTPDTISPYGFGSGQAQALANQAYGLGAQGLAQAGQAGAGLSGLQSTAQQQAMGMLGGLGGSTADRESEVYNRIRAMQSPEEQRQQLALEERLASQGRLGVQTAQYGGTPEQLAMAKAQEEAKNQAALQAMQQAQAEQQQQYAQGTGLATLTGQLAGQGSDLQTAAQQRAMQLSNMGMSAEQINSQLQSEGLSRGMQAGTYNRQGQQLFSDLLSAAQSRDIQRGEFGSEQQRLAAALRSQDIQNQLALAGGSQSALAQQLGLQTGYGQLGQGMMQMGFSPYEQMRADFGMGDLGAQLAASGRETGVGLLAQLGLGGLAEQTKLETLRNNLMNQMYQTAGGLFSGGGAGGGGNLGIDDGSIVGRGLNWLGGKIFGNDEPSGTWAGGGSVEDALAEYFRRNG